MAAGIQSLRQISQRHSRFVSWMKVVLPTIAGALMVTIMVWPRLPAHTGKFSPLLSRIAQGLGTALITIHPRYQGFDDHDQPFAVTADQAVQVAGSSDLWQLTGPKGDMTLPSGSWVALNSATGLYHQTDKTLDLAGAVQMFHDEGTSFKTASAHVDFDKEMALSTDPVEGHGPWGTIDSQGFRLEEGGSHIVFTGHAHLILRPKELPRK